ncbi:MAG TPA: hypothetical protein DEA22_08235 [Blastocatellia bacterium]|nr:hypothetical protein [Blastocatellia bacterium]
MEQQVAVEHNPREDIAEILDSSSAADQVKIETLNLLSANKLTEIDDAAKRARDKKERLPGGYWKLDSIYDSLANIYGDYPGQKVTDELWLNRIALLKRWKEDSPDLITPRVALAKALVGYGWFARGNATIDKVSAADHELFRQRIEAAEQELNEAVHAGFKCPAIAGEMLLIGMVKGWESDKFEALYRQAVAAEPDYLDYHLIKSENLTLKWNGKEGEWRKFFDRLPEFLVANHSKEADLIYFVVIAARANDSTMQINWAMISKERLKKGFGYLESSYGIDNLRLNQYALLMASTMDLEEAKTAFERIGSNRDGSVWSESTFNVFRTLAMKGIPKPTSNSARQ